MSEKKPAPAFSGETDLISYAHATSHQLQQITPKVAIIGGGAITVAEDITVDELKEILETSRSGSKAMNTTNALRCFLYGRILNCYREKLESQGYADAISQLRAWEDVDLTVANRSLIKWARMDAAVPDEERHEGLSPSHYIKAFVDVSTPRTATPALKRKFLIGRYNILREAAAQPDVKNSVWVKKQVDELRIKLGIKSNRKTVPRGIWIDRYIEYSAILRDWQDKDFEEHGVERRDVADNLKSVEAKLEELDLLPDVNQPGFKPSPLPDEKADEDEEDCEEEDEEEGDDEDYGLDEDEDQDDSTDDGFGDEEDDSLEAEDDEFEG